MRNCSHSEIRMQKRAEFLLSVLYHNLLSLSCSLRCWARESWHLNHLSNRFLSLSTDSPILSPYLYDFLCIWVGLLCAIFSWVFCCYWQVWFQFCYFGSAGSSSWDCISHSMAESLKGLRFTTEKMSGVFNHKSSWNNFSDNSLLLFFPCICRSLMTLQSISMKTTQNVQVTH